MKDLALITGITSGVGLSLAKYLSQRFHILGIGRDKQKLRSLFENDSNITTYEADLSDLCMTESVMDDILLKYQFIPFVINNAGVNMGGTDPIEDSKVNDLLHSLNVNTITPFIIMRKVIPAMKQRNFGRIINLTSGAPFNCFPHYASYSASKGALNALTVTAAKESAEYNIKINLMSPGPVRSQMSPHASMDPSACYPTVDYLLSLDEKGITGRFFWLGYEIPLFPNLEGIEWLEGRADHRYRRVI